MTPGYWIPPIAGLAFNVAPHVLATTFPRVDDGLPFAHARVAIGNWGRRQIALSEKERLYRVIIPDNIGLAGATVATWCLRDKIPLTLEMAPYLIAGLLLAISAFSQFRQLSYVFAVPLSRKVPLVGEKLAEFFKVLSPSDLRNYALFEKIAERIQNSAFVRALIEMLSKTAARILAPIPAHVR